MLHELERFALKHDLPEPTAIQETDGQHVFLYSKNKDRRYAYSLTWTHGQSHILWVMLNPGTGETENRRRNTFERCKQWSRAMGYGGMIFGNVFSLRSKSAKDLLALGPGPEAINEYALTYLSQLAPETIVAWATTVQSQINQTHCMAYCPIQSALVTQKLASPGTHCMSRVRRLLYCGKTLQRRRARPNPSLKRSTNGRPPSPGWWYSYIFTSPGLASCRRCPLSSNVMPRQSRLSNAWAAATAKCECKSSPFQFPPTSFYQRHCKSDHCSLRAQPRRTARTVPVQIWGVRPAGSKQSFCAEQIQRTRSLAGTILCSAALSQWRAQDQKRCNSNPLPNHIPKSGPALSASSWSQGLPTAAFLP